MDRRTLLVAASTAPLAALPAVSAPTQDSLSPLLDKWHLIRAEYSTMPDPEGMLETDRHKEIMAEMLSIELTICSTVPETPQEAAAQIRYAIADRLVGGHYTNNKDTLLFQNLLEALNRSKLI